eukprot:m.221302 g.221302  ORF g.221302 m.221302 type:complete len:148 (+) comp10558_c0_seq1:2957-3400(+)
MGSTRPDLMDGDRSVLGEDTLERGESASIFTGRKPWVKPVTFFRFTMSAGPIGLAYDAEKAKAGLQETWQSLQALQHTVAGDLDAASTHAAVQSYRKLPSFGVNWGIIGVEEAQAQQVADQVRDKLNAANARLGSNCLPLPRAFGAQ